MIAAAAKPLPDIEHREFGGFADARVVMLDEAGHGTSAFYRTRAMTHRLIEQPGVIIVAVEADWSAAAVVNPYVSLPAPSMPAWSRMPRSATAPAAAGAFVQELACDGTELLGRGAHRHRQPGSRLGWQSGSGQVAGDDDADPSA
ncbi:hypothetical protein [Rhodopila sp.]|uniref:hypothetical protein n=1 Tax=Rhodopila sp. TaxID=2480087 RepID=UPI003D09E861